MFGVSFVKKRQFFSMGSRALNTVNTNPINLEWDPGRVLFGLSRIGYTPASAICDIIDNSVRAQAENISVIIRKEREELNDGRRNNVCEYIVIDDGQGMDESGMKGALKLGSSDEDYEEHSLSKFGLGLKSAAFSQGDELILISSTGNDSFRKLTVSLPKISDHGSYFAEASELNDGEKKLVDEYLSGGKGTIVRVTAVRKVNHPPIKRTVEDLRGRIGVIYYYFLKGGTQIVVDGERYNPVDVLFTDEADVHGNLDEHEWDGRSVNWIERTKEVCLDTESEVFAIIEVTHLVHPPTFELDERGGRARARLKYGIEAGNYGFYVYRNKRLISWAEKFGIIPQDQDFYAFRGRIIIDESADDCFNIDVKKSSITLSDEAWRTISDFSDEYKRKAKGAWQTATRLMKEKEGKDPNERANDLVSDFDPPEVLPGEPIESEEAQTKIKERESEVIEQMSQIAQSQAARAKGEREGRDVSADEVTREEIQEVLRGEASPTSNKIFRVEYVEDNVLWEPYYDADCGPSVRINKYHRFSRVLFEDNSENANLQILFDLFLLQLASAEIYMRKRSRSADSEVSETVISEFRRVVSEYLAALCREKSEQLPPFKEI